MTLLENITDEKKMVNSYLFLRKLKFRPFLVTAVELTSDRYNRVIMNPYLLGSSFTV